MTKIIKLTSHCKYDDDSVEVLYLNVASIVTISEIKVGSRIQYGLHGDEICTAYDDRNPDELMNLINGI